MAFSAPPSPTAAFVSYLMYTQLDLLLFVSTDQLPADFYVHVSMTVVAEDTVQVPCVLLFKAVRSIKNGSYISNLTWVSAPYIAGCYQSLLERQSTSSLTAALFKTEQPFSAIHTFHTHHLHNALCQCSLLVSHRQFSGRKISIKQADESDTSSLSKKPKRHQVSQSTFTKQQTQLKQGHQTMTWVRCDTDRSNPTVVDTLWCHACRTIEAKIIGMKNYSSV